MKTSALFLAAFFSVLPANAQVPDTLKLALPLSIAEGQAGARLGYSVAAEDPYIIAGARDEDVGGITDVGAVRVFDSATGALLHNLLSPTAEAYGAFGESVAISGTRIAVGAPGDVTGVDRSGRVYVYDLSSPTPAIPVATLSHPAPENGDRFGYAVAISGTLVVVGCPGNDLPIGSYDQGSAYVYDVAGGTPSGPAVTMDNPIPERGEYFGNAVAISGSRIVVGESGNRLNGIFGGSAHVYNYPSTSPAYTLDNPEPDLHDEFGHSVVVSGSRVVVGAPGNRAAGGISAGSTYIYNLTNPTPTVPDLTINNPAPGNNDRYGHAVAISGAFVAVGASQDDNYAIGTGGVWFYNIFSGTPSTPVRFLHSSRFGSRFGNAIAFAANILVVGFPQEAFAGVSSGGIHVFTPGPASRFNHAMMTAGLSGGNALTHALPFGDGVPNLIKYAFNMNLAAADRRTMISGGTAGLPHVSRVSGEAPIFRIEYLRRLDAGLNYLPETSSSLEANDWEPIPGIPQRTPVNTSWERVIHEVPATADRMFGRVGVELGS